jgi:adenine-specific DNA-methyltransferase
MAGKHDDLTHAPLVEPLGPHQETNEREEIEADAAVAANFIASRIHAELSDKFPPRDNPIIEGVTFDTLRWLRMAHAGRVKWMISTRPATPATGIGTATTSQ